MIINSLLFIYIKKLSWEATACQVKNLQSYYNVLPAAHQLYEERQLAILEIQGKAPPFLSSEEALTGDGVTRVETCGGMGRGMSSGNRKDP